MLRAKKKKKNTKHEEVKRAKKYTISQRKELKVRQRGKELSKRGRLEGGGVEKVDRRCS